MTEDVAQYALIGMSGAFGVGLIGFVACLLLRRRKERPYEHGYDEWLRKTHARLVTKRPLSWAWDLAFDGDTSAAWLRDFALQREYWASWALVQGHLVAVDQGDAPPALKPFLDVGPLPLPEGSPVVSPALDAINRFNHTVDEYQHGQEIREWLER